MNLLELQAALIGRTVIGVSEHNHFEYEGIDTFEGVKLHLDNGDQIALDLFWDYTHLGVIAVHHPAPV